MRTSEKVGEIAGALAKAQAAIETLTKDRTAQIKSDKGDYSYQYATLTSVVEAIRGPLSENGIATCQFPEIDDRGNAVVITQLIHASGEWLESRLAVHPGKGGAQALGSAISYARRYSLLSMCGVAPTDDDDDGASGVTAPKKAKPKRIPADQIPAVMTVEVTTVDGETGEYHTATYDLPDEENSVRAAIDADMTEAGVRGEGAVREAWDRHRKAVAQLGPEAQAALKKKGQELLGVNRRAAKEAVAAHQGEPDPVPTVGPPTPPPAAYDMPDLPEFLKRDQNGGASDGG